MTNLKTLLGNYRRNQDGNFAMMAAFGSTMLLTVVGVAIDIHGLTNMRSKMQDRLDAGVLAAASSGYTKKNELLEVVVENVDESGTPSSKMYPTIKLENDELIAEANGKYKPMILGMFGQGEMDIEVTSAAPIAMDVPVNLALVLDSTGSMQGSNMTDLQAAATGLVDVMRKRNNPDHRISVVPFNRYVNVGMTRRNASWMQVMPDGTGTPGACYPELTASSTGCTTVTGTSYQNDILVSGTITSGCSYTYTPTGNTICPSAPTYTWHGCAGSRETPLNTQADANTANRIPGAMNETCGEEILPLTNNMDDVDAKIAALIPQGDTYIPAGLVWGWRTLTPNHPFTEAATSPTETNQAIVLMTDGFNTVSLADRYSSEYTHAAYDGDNYHAPHMPGSTRDTNAQALILEICDNIKADGITIFTVAYKLPAGSSSMTDLLETCASSPSAAFEAKDAKQLKKAFKTIGQSFQSVRLSK